MTANHNAASIDLFGALPAETLKNILLHFVEQSFDAIVITTGDVDDHKIVYANSKFCKMTGYTLGELVGNKPSMLQGPKTNYKLISNLKQKIAANKPFVGATTNYKKDGTPYHVQWNIHSILSSSGETEYYISIQRDMSTLKSILSRLKSTNDEFRHFIQCLSMSNNVGNHEGDISQAVVRDASKEILDNEALFSRDLRDNSATELFDTDELFDFSEGDTGVMPVAHAKQQISAQQFFAQTPVDNLTVKHMVDLVADLANSVSLYSVASDKATEKDNILNDLRELANTVFYFEEFIDISVILNELANKLDATEQDFNDMMVEVFHGLCDDMSTWIKDVFDEKTAPDIHMYDASITSAAKQIMVFAR